MTILLLSACDFDLAALIFFFSAFLILFFLSPTFPLHEPYLVVFSFSLFFFSLDFLFTIPSRALIFPW